MNELAVHVFDAYHDYRCNLNASRWRYRLICFEDNYRDGVAMALSGVAEALKLRSQSHVDDCIAFLIVDPLYHGSGYQKERVWSRISKFTIRHDQLEKLEFVSLALLDRKLRRDFWYMCRAMNKLGSSGFWCQVEKVARSAEGSKQLRALWLLSYKDSLEVGESQRIYVRMQILGFRFGKS